MEEISISENGEQSKEKLGEKREFHVEVKRHGYGYVRVLAHSKDEAIKAAEAMNVKRLLSYYKEKYEFVTTGEAELPNGD
jgi:transcriptional regulator CtsR